jgi:hypothetical protein
MAQDNRLVQEFQENTLVFDIGSVGSEPPTGVVSGSGTYGGAVMPYRQSPAGGLSDALVALSGLGTPGETDSVNKHPINRVAVFENEIHNIGQGQWHKQNETTGSWDVVINLNNYNASTAHQNIGLYPVFNQETNKRYLVTAYLTTGNLKWVGIAYNKDDNVVTSGALSLSQGGSSADFSPQDCQLGNNIYFMGSDTDNRVMILHGLNLDITGSTLEPMIRPVDLCAYSGSVYAAYKDSTVGGAVGNSGVVTIGRVDAGSVRPILRLPFENYPLSFPTTPELGYAVTDVSASIPRQKCLLFVDNNPPTASGNPTVWLYYQNNPRFTPVGGGSADVYGWSVWELEGDGLGGLSVVQQNDMLMGGYRTGLGENVIPVGNVDQAVISY